MRVAHVRSLTARRRAPPSPLRRQERALADAVVTSAAPRSANAAARERWYARVAALDASLHAAAAAPAAATDVSADRIAPRRRLAAALFS